MKLFKLKHLMFLSKKAASYALWAKLQVSTKPPKEGKYSLKGKTQKLKLVRVEEFRKE